MSIGGIGSLRWGIRATELEALLLLARRLLKPSHGVPWLVNDFAVAFLALPVVLPPTLQRTTEVGSIEWESLAMLGRHHEVAVLVLAVGPGRRGRLPRRVCEGQRSWRACPCARSGDRHVSEMAASLVLAAERSGRGWVVVGGLAGCRGTALRSPLKSL